MKKFSQFLLTGCLLLGCGKDEVKDEVIDTDIQRPKTKDPIQNHQTPKKEGQNQNKQPNPDSQTIPENPKPPTTLVLQSDDNGSGTKLQSATQITVIPDVINKDGNAVYKVFQIAGKSNVLDFEKNFKEIEDLLSQDKSLFVQDEDGNTPLHVFLANLDLADGSFEKYKKRDILCFALLPIIAKFPEKFVEVLKWANKKGETPVSMIEKVRGCEIFYKYLDALKNTQSPEEIKKVAERIQREAEGKIFHSVKIDIVDGVFVETLEDVDEASIAAYKITPNIEEDPLWEKLGEGGCGWVYGIKEGDFVIKKTKAMRDYSGGLGDIMDSLRDIYVGSTVNSKFVMHYDAVFRSTPENYFIRMERAEKSFEAYLKGISKSDLYISDNVNKMCLWFYQLCEGVQDLFDKGICDWDLLYENVMIDKLGNLKIIDFGQSHIKAMSPDLFAENIPKVWNFVLLFLKSILNGTMYCTEEVNYTKRDEVSRNQYKGSDADNKDTIDEAFDLIQKLCGVEKNEKFIEEIRKTNFYLKGKQIWEAGL